MNLIRRSVGGFFVAACLSLPTCPIAAAAQDMEAAVQEMNAAWDAALNAGNAADVAAMYADDAKVVTGDGTVKQGRAEIQALFQGFIDSGFGQHKITMDDVDGTSDLIYETGSWSGVGGDGNTYGGKIVNIYERQDDGSWKTVLHMWN